MASTYTKVPSLIDPLAQQIQGIKAHLESFDQEFFLGAILFGSCSRAEATYRSDIDIMLIFDQNNLDFSFVQKTRDRIENHFSVHKLSHLLNEPLKAEFQVVRFSVFQSKEDEMKNNLKTGLCLVDKFGLLKREMEILHEQS
ncbi:MAG: nucleotidyltransferase domain-containing protein [Pseudobdellovibrionaceae bacterium]